jgi:phospholipase/carboxylesterase
MENEIEAMNIKDWVLRVREPQGDGPFPVYLLLHGWTGDETSMWIFSSRLPDNTLLIAPRGIYNTRLGGYGWYPQEKRTGLPAETGDWPHMDEFVPAIDGILDLLSDDDFPRADFANLHLVGFSQGAALTYALALLHPEKFADFAGLAGFMPNGVEDVMDNQPLAAKRVYVTHGTQDELVPVAKARHAVEVLENAGAKVAYCEDDVGHKLSATCFRGMQEFFARQK